MICRRCNCEIAPRDLPLQYQQPEGPFRLAGGGGRYIVEDANGLVLGDELTVATLNRLWREARG